jgi:hypothetical protein
MLNLSVKYWWHLNNLCFNNNNKIVIDALIENRKLCNNNEMFTWSTGIKHIFNSVGRLDVWNKPNICSKSNIFNIIDVGLKEIYCNLWSKIISSQSKLKTYCYIKKQLMLENYIIMFKRYSRSMFTKLRVSAHTLMVEKGRYLSPKMPIHERICNHCCLNKIEDEYHFII